MKSAGVSFDEALAVLKLMVAEPERVLGLSAMDGASYGPFPFFLDEAEVTISFAGGQVEGVASVRVGRRFSNDRDWDQNPWDALSEVEVELLAVSLRGVGVK